MRTRVPINMKFLDIFVSKEKTINENMGDRFALLIVALHWQREKCIRIRSISIFGIDSEITLSNYKARNNGQSILFIVVVVA